MVQKEKFTEHITLCPHYFYPYVDWDLIEAELSETVTLSNSRKRKYYEVPIAFDIEVTSFMSSQLEKSACMYAWGLSIQGYVILGRTWEEFHEVYDKLVELFEPDDNRRIIIYIQNLAYEFQFICHRFEWLSVFCLKERKPLKALTTEYVEFRCSYMLSGFSLKVIGENLQRYKIEKMDGDLDYDKMRHHLTPLTQKEWKYIINDVQVVVAYIQETAENDGGYHKIPLTKTGYVREYCREQCFKAKNYRKMIHNMTVSYEEYKQLKRAFAGGFTHANWHYTDTTLHNMDSYDFTSSYPYVMVAEKFPMSTSREIVIDSDKQFRECLEKYCCLFDLEIEGLDGWDAPDNILSFSKCRSVKNPKLNNGRIITADSLITTVTEVDFKCLEKFYKWERFRVSNFRVYDKMYLPTSFVRAILELYQDKTILKDVEGKEVEYLKSKGMINSAFGMAVTDIIRDEDTFDDGWVSIKADGEDAIRQYNQSKKRFLFYPWGVWVTAYARANLFSGILEFGDDYVYADTDSVKVRNAYRHEKYLADYNNEVENKLRKACSYHGIDFEMTRPKTKEGKEKPLGVWDFDGHYRMFKTLGAKRYMTEKLSKRGEYEVSITVAGLNKKTAVPYIINEARKRGVSPFDIFTNNLNIPAGETGKNTHAYIDYEQSSRLEDYLGNIAVVHEYSAVHLSPAEYSLSLEEGYLKLIKGYRLEEV